MYFLRKYKVSARLLTGSSPEYKALEKTVAKIFNKEAALSNDNKTSEDSSKNTVSSL